MSTDPDRKPGTIRVEVACATPERQTLLQIDVPEGCTLAEAIDRSGIRDKFPEIEIDPEALGIFGRKMPPNQVLQSGDRVEIYRPLIADPKEARRRRAEKKKEA